MVNSWIGICVDFLNIILSGVSCVLYVWETYDSDQKKLFETIDLAFCAFFIADYILRVFLADNRLKYIRSPMASIDLLTLVPVVFAFVTISTNFALLYQLIRVLRVLRIVRINRFILSNATSEISQQLTMLVTTVVTAAFFCAGIVHIFENDYRESHHLATLEFHEACYFVVVTISTVGYGDINPESDLSKLAVMILICAALVYIPKSTNHLVSLMSARSVYARNRFNPSPNTDFVLVCGSLDVMAARAFLTELFHEDHGNVDLQAVLLCEQLPSAAMENMLRTQYSLNVTYLQGSPLDANDLLRASVLRCKTCFLLCNKFTNDPDTEDAATILRALSIKRFVLQYTGKDIRTCVQLLRLENKQHFTLSHEIMMKDHLPSDSNGVVEEGKGQHVMQIRGMYKFESRVQEAKSSVKHLSSCESEHQSELDLDVAKKTQQIQQDPLICVNEIKMNLLAQACLCPGIITMIGNLVMSVDAPGDTSGKGNEWLDEYNEGSEFEIYRTKLSKVFKGVPFAKASQLVHAATGALMFALELNGGGLSRVIMNPGNFLLPDIDEYDVHCFVIAQDLESAELADLDAALYFQGGRRNSVSNNTDPGKTNFDSQSKRARSFARLYSIKASDPRQDLARQILAAKQQPDADSDNDSEPDAGEPEAKADAGKDSPSTNATEKPRKGSKSKIGGAGRGWGILKSTLPSRAKKTPDAAEVAKESDDQAGSSNYFYLEVPMLLERITVRHSLARDFPKVKEHIIICGNLSGLFILIRTLRARHLSKMLPVVILHPEPLPFHLWNQIAQFPLLYFVQGSATERRDLGRAGAKYASRAIVLARSRDAQVASSDETMSDAHAIFAHQGIIGLNKNIQIVTELINESNVGFLDIGGHKAPAHKPPGDNSLSERTLTRSVASSNYFNALQFIAGIVYSPSMLDTLICQSFYNPHITTVFQQLIAGNSDCEDGDSRAVAAAIAHSAARSEEGARIAARRAFVQKTKQSHLFQIPVPKEMHDFDYAHLFQTLSTEYGMIPLGLLRGIQSPLSDHYKGNQIAYVFTNPPGDTVLSRADKVFVLCKDAPSSKLAGVPLADLLSNMSQLSKGPAMAASPQDEKSENGRADVEKLSKDIAELRDAMNEIRVALGLRNRKATVATEEIEEIKSETVIATEL
ncbi:Calcium-activated potassium channel subunit alpha-1 [Hondaea fermentalgiana]|uniref:Calcium-activated potassium channel subunit alpha-1 n=1 Tax=Hondaea fermentalgiana TaxID=2315210 RepID=A0A2R5G5G9_9STRA|nr:Calcium-activated potassium channel subunit alpha-1 [Hondaea fermentalgiana]|eukprot:GBG26292.1 Calcium-activated potassium channel subunit alpha-1 [Hondaea fermentalgiana]